MVGTIYKIIIIKKSYNFCKTFLIIFYFNKDISSSISIALSPKDEKCLT
jgi:hypothetical protein